MKEIKCYTCKNRNLDPVPDDLPCVDCWNEMDYVNYESKTLEELKKDLEDNRLIILDWLNSGRECDDEMEKLIFGSEAIVMKIIKLELNK